MLVSNTSHVIRVCDLQKSYSAGGVALDNISLNVPTGKRVALIGPNGAGKSTLLKCLVGLQDNSGGSVSIFNETFEVRPDRKQRSAIRKKIGFVFQAHGLVKRLSALSNVVHGFLGQPGSWRGFTQATARQDWRLKALDALEAVNLLNKSNSRVDELSGGQAQRVAIARALVREPELIIADEPAASLDPAAGHEVMQQFVQMAAAKGITLIFTSHNMQHALEYSDHIVALQSGRIIVDESTSALTESDLLQVFDN